VKKEKKYGYNALLTDKLLRWLDEAESKKRQRLMYLLSTILTHKQDKHPGAWSVLKMEYLRQVDPTATEDLKLLKDAAVIEVKNYLAGRNSRLYRIRKEYEGPAIFRAVTDMKILNRIKEARISIAKHNSRQYPELNRMTKSVAINLPAAEATIEERYQATEDKETAEARRTYSLAEIEKIRSREIFHTVNDTNHRYDSNFTRLPSELVPHLSIDGKPLHEVDIVNSQIFFSVCLFNPSPEVLRVMKDYLGQIFTIQIIKLQLSYCQDVQRYALSAISGKFYEDMMQLFDLKSRAEVKELCFTVLFSRNNAIRYSKEVRKFREVYPNVYRMFSEIKKDGHNKLAILLQRIEADVMLNHVAPAIMKKLPKVKFITKHDSLLPASLLVAGQATEVANIMTETIEEITGLRPKLKIKEAKTDFSPQIPSFQSNTNTSPVTTSNNPPSDTLYPIIQTETLQVIENEKVKRSRLNKKVKKQKKMVKRIVKQISVKQASVTVVDGNKSVSLGAMPAPGLSFNTMNKSVNITMTKRGSPHVIEIFTDPDDSHFCNVILRKSKTGLVACSHYILTSDVPQWQRTFEADGFIITNSNNQ
jgi:hypothetical protein